MNDIKRVAERKQSESKAAMGYGAALPFGIHQAAPTMAGRIILH